MTRVFKYGGIAIACTAIVVLSSLTLFLCSAWLLRSAPLVHTMALTALSLCGSGVAALMEHPAFPRSAPGISKLPRMSVGGLKGEQRTARNIDHAFLDLP